MTIRTFLGVSQTFLSVVFVVFLFLLIATFLNEFDVARCGRGCDLQGRQDNPGRVLQPLASLVAIQVQNTTR